MSEGWHLFKTKKIYIINNITCTGVQQKSFRKGYSWKNLLI